MFLFKKKQQQNHRPSFKLANDVNGECCCLLTVYSSHSEILLYYFCKFFQKKEQKTIRCYSTKKEQVPIYYVYSKKYGVITICRYFWCVRMYAYTFQDQWANQNDKNTSKIVIKYTTIKRNKKVENNKQNIK